MTTRKPIKAKGILALWQHESVRLLVMAVLSYAIARLVFALFAGENFRFEWMMNRLLPLAFLGAAVYVFSNRFEPEIRPGRRQFHPQILLEICFSLGVVTFVHFYDPMLWVDDAGFILRYLDNFQDGCFFCFNISEGPVFGISSFVYGLFTGLLVWTGIFEPATALMVASYIGLFFSAFLLFRIIRTVIAHPSLAFFAWLFTLTFSNAYWEMANSGMEAPVHLSICLAAIWFFIQNKSRGMWFFLAFAAISKLDAVPISVIVGCFWLVKNRSKILPISFRNKEFQDLLLFGILPVVAYIGIATLIFGSPLPQSAYAKAFFHSHPDDHWFPFLTWFSGQPWRLPILWAFLITFLIHHGFALLYREKREIYHLVIGWCFIGVMTLYYFYNPAEKMVWYYVLPEILMLLQLSLSLVFIFELLLARAAFTGLHLIFGATFLLFWTANLYEVRWFRKYERIVEVERNMAGKYLATQTTSQDTVLAGHGLMGAYTDAYVLDLTGLNSRLATDFKLDAMEMVRQLNIHWIAMHSWPNYLEIATEEGYIEDTVFYDITLHEYPAWRIWRKAKPGETVLRTQRLDSLQMSGTGVQHRASSGFHRIIAQDLHLQIPAKDSAAQSIAFAVYRKEIPFNIELEIVSGDSVVHKRTLEIAPRPEKQGPPYFSQAVRLPLQALGPVNTLRTIKMRATGIPEGFEIVDPMLYFPAGMTK